MKIKTAYMDEITIDPENIFIFDYGIPGFEDEKNFVLLPIEENSIFQILQSTKTENLAFVITSPYVMATDYNFTLDDAIVNSLDIKSENEVAVFAIVTLQETLAESTVNLKAPIVINTTNKKAKQVILDNEAFTIRHQIPLESVKG